jgi:hypothetical protein
MPPFASRVTILSESRPSTARSIYHRLVTSRPDGPAAFERAQLGDFAESDAFVRANAGARDAETRGWTLALAAQSAIARSDHGALPALDEATDLAGGAPSEALDRACHLVERVHWLALDGSARERWLPLHERVGAGGARLRLSRAWFDLACGPPFERSDEPSISEERDPAVVIEAASLEAMRASAARDLAEATKIARRASRMARTESFPEEEYLANVVLSRVRRLAGRPHLAARILGALDRVAPDAWRPWIGWELVLAGASDVSDRARGFTAALLEWSRAIGAADFAAIARSRRELGDRVHGELRRDLETVEALLGLSDPEERTRAWIFGEVHAVVDGLHGFGAGETGAEAAMVLAAPGTRARRILTIAARCHAERAAILPAGPGRQARTEATIALLALAGEGGLDEDDLFRHIYGFEYKPELHRAVRNMLLHRVRGRLEEVATLERSGRMVRVLPLRAFLVPDPRCSPPPEDAVLLAIARWGRVSPKDTATRLGIPLRTAQAILRRLADEGVFRVEADGRALFYTLEDTTFREPTWLSRRADLADGGAAPT